MNLLDNIALFLMTQGSSDVAAVMFEQTSHEIIFYFAKNHAATCLHRVASEYCFISLRHQRMHHPTPHSCHPHLSQHDHPRLKKVIRCLQNPFVIFEDDGGGSREHLVPRMPQLFSTGRSSTSVLRSYIAAVRVVLIAKCTNKELEKLIRFASVIGSYKDLNKIISDDTTI